MYKPMKFIRDICNKMSVGARMIIAFPNMLEMIKRKYTNCINFDRDGTHVLYYVEVIISSQYILHAAAYC